MSDKPLFGSNPAETKQAAGESAEAERSNTESLATDFLESVSSELGGKEGLLGLASSGLSNIQFDENFCLTKADLVDSIYDTLPFDKIKAAKIVEDWIELIKQGLERDDKVMLSGFGVFEVKSKKSRPGRNPQTGERITLAPRKVVKFKPSQILKKQVNEGKQD